METEANDALTALDPAFRSLLRARAMVTAALLLVIAGASERVAELPGGVLLVPALLLSAWLVLVLPGRRFERWGYAFSADRLRVVHGFLFHHDSVVPLGRIQHIDVDQGPLMRHWGLATLTVHTAGSHGASVSLPGLALPQAEAMREAIRGHIGLGQG